MFAFRRSTWGEDRVFVVGEDGELCGLPAAWTDAAAADPFVTVAAGRSRLRVTDLLALADLLAALADSEAAGTAEAVKPTTPHM